MVCDRQGRPLCPAILWMDGPRGGGGPGKTEPADHPVMDYCGGGDAADGWSRSTMWAAAAPPGSYDRAEVICEALDFVNFA